MRDKPKTAYAMRRFKTLVEVLALEKSDELKLTDLQTLAKLWGVNPHDSYSELLQRLAKYVVEYHQSVPDDVLLSYDPIDNLDK